MASAKEAKARHMRLIASGVCVKCGKPRDGNSNWRCRACLRKLANYARDRSLAAKAWRGNQDEPDELAE